MPLLVNIGLNAADTVMSSASALRESSRALGHPDDWGVRVSDTEPTLVLYFSEREATPDEPPLADVLYDLAERLRQDCIAAWGGPAGAERGSLHGPKAGAWGPFSPALFVGIDGRRLSETVAVANAA